MHETHFGSNILFMVVVGNGVLELGTDTFHHWHSIGIRLGSEKDF